MTDLAAVARRAFLGCIGSLKDSWQAAADAVLEAHKEERWAGRGGGFIDAQDYAEARVAAERRRIVAKLRDREKEALELAGGDEEHPMYFAAEFIHHTITQLEAPPCS